MWVFQINPRLSVFQQDVHLLLEQEDLQWRQRSKENWFKHGDRNSKYFHACANQRRKTNQINKIEDVRGLVWETQEDIGQAFINYYDNLFTSEFSGDMESCLSATERRVTNDMNNQLLQEFTVAEISEALNQMPALKAPGPDGFAACFYQNNWATVANEVCSTVLNFLNSGFMNNELNFTYIALIPKTKNPSSVTEFRPISLCNVFTKLSQRCWLIG
jgi:hypothetical protein